jgi:hypothetical protein
MERIARGWPGFVGWYRGRPFVGGALTVLAGLEMFFSGQLDVGKIHIQVGIEGLQATIIPILMVILGVFAITMPIHRVFYGVISLVVAVYSLIGVNLGGFFIGMLLGSVGGVLIVSWMPKMGMPRMVGAESEAESDAAALPGVRSGAVPDVAAEAASRPMAASPAMSDPESQPDRPKPRPWPQPESESWSESESQPEAESQPQSRSGSHLPLARRRA